jgi:hypothetical protein
MAVAIPEPMPARRDGDVERHDPPGPNPGGLYGPDVHKQVLSYLTTHQDHYHRLFDVLLDRISGLVEEKTEMLRRIEELEERAK